MIRSGIAFGVSTRAFASAAEKRRSSKAFPMTQPLMLSRRLSETTSWIDATPPDAMMRSDVIARSCR